MLMLLFKKRRSRMSTSVEANLETGDLDRAALERLGIKYELHESFPLSELDVDASRAAWGQARLDEPVDEEHVEEMLAELERGLDFPPIIFYRNDGGRAVVISGNHRRRTFERAGLETIAAYEATGLTGLRIDDERVLRLIYEANHGHGKAVSLDDRVLQALGLVDHGYNVRAAAAAVGIPESRVRDHHDAARATRRLEEQLGIDTSRIPITAQRRLVNIRNDRVLKEAAKLVDEMPSKTQDVNELVRAVNAERTEAAQLAVVEDFAAALRARGPTRPRRGRVPAKDVEVRKFATAVATIARFDAETLREGLASDYRDELRSRVQEALATLETASTLL
jgi:hypothetical protein